MAFFWLILTARMLFVFDSQQGRSGRGRAMGCLSSRKNSQVPPFEPCSRRRCTCAQRVLGSIDFYMPCESHVRASTHARSREPTHHARRPTRTAAARLTQRRPTGFLGSTTNNNNRLGGLGGLEVAQGQQKVMTPGGRLPLPDQRKEEEAQEEAEEEGELAGEEAAEEEWEHPEQEGGPCNWPGACNRGKFEGKKPGPDPKQRVAFTCTHLGPTSYFGPTCLPGNPHLAGPACPRWVRRERRMCVCEREISLRPGLCRIGVCVWCSNVWVCDIAETRGVAWVIPQKTDGMAVSECVVQSCVCVWNIAETRRACVWNR